MNIRTRLVLLVVAAWLPAIGALTLSARSSYEREAQAAQVRIRDSARALAFLTDREIDTRAAIATTLGASHAVRDADFHRFYEEAKAATDGTDNWALLVTGTQQQVNTRVPFGTALPGRAWQSNPALLSAGAEVSNLRESPITKQPVLTVFAPERFATPPRYNIGISFSPRVLQTLLDQQKLPQGWIGAILDREGIIVARSRDPDKWVGVKATPDIVKAAASRAETFVDAKTLDGVATTAFVAHSAKYGWSYVIGLPRSALVTSAQRSAAEAVTAATLLLLISFGFALYGARRISAPVLALKQAAIELGRDQVPSRLNTGLSEADEVSGALHAAGLRACEATKTLESRVEVAVRQTEEAQVNLLVSQKHEAIGRLTGGLAHDFNNLLQTIRTGLHVLDRVTSDASGRRVIEASQRAVTRAAALVQQMLAFGRAKPLQLQAVDLSDFLLRLRELLAGALGSRVQLKAEVDPELPPVHADPGQLELALLNLVFNARDALPQGGSVVIRGRLARPEEVADLEAGPYVCIETADTGSGMDPQLLSKVFDPYFTTKPIGRGSGLGLAQVRAFARMSGGKADISSELGKGTRVSLFLKPSNEVEKPRPGGAPPAPVLPSLRILFAEDDALAASVVGPALEAMGHRLTHACTADEALEQLTAGHAFDLLFTDVVMPGKLSGIDLANACRQRWPTLPVVVASGFSVQMADADTQVLAKPYSINDLLGACARALEQNASR